MGLLDFLIRPSYRDYQNQQDQREINQRNALNEMGQIYRQFMAQEERQQADLLARADAAQEKQLKQQKDLQTRSEIAEKVKDVYSSVGNDVTRDSNTLAAYLTDYNNHLENEHAQKLGVEAPHASGDLAPALVNAHEERWSFETPSFSEEERQFTREDRQLTEDDHLTI